MPSVRSLAQSLGIPERTLRRAVGEGLVKGTRVGERRYTTTLREEDYLRRHWPLLAALRQALRTEPGARLAVLFGSTAAGTATPSSDVDIMVVLSDPAHARLAQLAGRLSARTGRDVQLVRQQDAERSPELMASILRAGRVLIDRDRMWPGLKADERRWQRLADESSVPLLNAVERDG